MSFWPAGFDYRAAAACKMDLVEMDTPDGTFRFILGADGVFTDVSGNTWVGSTLISSEGLGFGLGGTAKASSMTLRYFADPAMEADLIAEVRALGSDYVRGYALRRYAQPFQSPEEMFAPVYPPRLFATMIMDHLSFHEPDGLTRMITLHMESVFKVRGGATGRVYNTTDHSDQLGASNPSYEYIPTEPRTERPFVG